MCKEEKIYKKKKKHKKRNIYKEDEIFILMTSDNNIYTVHEITAWSSVTVRHDLMCDRQDSFSASHNDQQDSKFQLYHIQKTSTNCE